MLPNRKTAFVTGGSGFLGRNLIEYLVARGWSVRALARSATAIAAVQAIGATSIPGDLDDETAMTDGMYDCDVVFHCAAYAKEWGPVDEFVRANVDGTRHVLAAARTARVRRVVHVSTEAVLAGSGPLVNLDESRILPSESIGYYAQTKAMAERVVGQYVAAGGDAVIVRPRLIWGKGDTSLMPAITEAVRAGKFAWISGGRHLSSTCHVKNVCEGMLCAAERGRAGEVYFLTDGKPVEFRSFLGKLIELAGIAAPKRTVPRWLITFIAAIVEPLWSMFRPRSAPPVTRMAVVLFGGEVTVIDKKARNEIGYRGELSVDDGMAELRV